MAEEVQTVHMSDGCAIKVKILGNDNPNKPLMIAVHGAPGLSTHKEPIAQYKDFADTFRLLVFDMRGCGESDLKPPFTHEQWVQDIEELRQWAKADKFVMIGSSHGGFLTLEYTVAHPKHLYGSIIGDAGAQWAHWGIAQAAVNAMTDSRWKADPEMIMRILCGGNRSDEDIGQSLAAVFPLYAVPEHLQSEVEVNIAEALDGAIVPHYETNNAAHKHCLSRFDLRDRLHEIGVPVFVYCGRYDWICPPKLSEDMAAGIKNSKLVIYEKSGHIAALEEKTKFQKDAREFIKGLKIPGA